MNTTTFNPPTQVATCEATRIRSGNEETCRDEAVALAASGDAVYPVCAFHTRTMTALTLQQTLEQGWLA